MSDPYCLAFVLCDGVHQDPQTRKFTLNGIFHGLRAQKFPAVIQFAAYFALTDGLGPARIALLLTQADQGIAPDAPEEPIFRMEQDATFNDRFDVLEGVIFVQGPVPAPGTYIVELYAGATPMMARRLVVMGPSQR